MDDSERAIAAARLLASASYATEPPTTVHVHTPHDVVDLVRQVLQRWMATSCEEAAKVVADKTRLCFTSQGVSVDLYFSSDATTPGVKLLMYAERPVPRQ